MTDNCSGDCGKDSMVVNTSGFNDTACCERHIKPAEAAMPPLPDPVALPLWSFPGASAPSQWDSVEPHTVGSAAGGTSFVDTGCYYIRLTPTSLQAAARYQLEGTLRVSRTGAAFSASGDLYKSDVCSDPIYCPSLIGDQSGAAGIPVFPRKHYGYYLRVNGVPENTHDNCGRNLEMEMFRFDQSTQSWGPAESVTVDLRLSTGIDSVHYWQGDLKTKAGVLRGNFLMVRISSFLRHAVIEMDCVKDSPPPVIDIPERDIDGNFKSTKIKSGRIWREVFEKAGWDVTINLSHGNVEEPLDQSWSNGELHKTMLEYRDEDSLDKEWRYHLLAVKKLDDEAFGVMYDNTVKGINEIPREGASVASHVTFSNTDSWGHLKGTTFMNCKEAYIRTAIHEIGHAMLLYHPDNPYENYIMQRTENIAFHASSYKTFPGCIKWSFSPRDIHMLCHLPDIAIRPGGICFGTPYQRIPVNIRDEIMEADGVSLKVEAVNPVLPIGAPMRIKYTLINNTDKPQVVPASLRMKSGHVSGKVIDPLGAAQDFATIVVFTTNDAFEEKDTRVLNKGETFSDSATLLWGAEGPLCPTSGYYRVIMQLDWYVGGLHKRIAGHVGIMVMPPENPQHAEAALTVFSTPKILLALALGGRHEHVKAGNEAIIKALKNPVLRPHYEFIYARCISNPHFGLVAELERAAEMINEKSEISSAELITFAWIVWKYGERTSKQVLSRLMELFLFKSKKLNFEGDDKDTFEFHLEEIRKYISSK